MSVNVLEQLKTKRTGTKSSITKLVNKINNTLNNETSTVTLNWLEEQKALLIDKETKLFELDEKIENEITDLKKLEEEVETNQEYRENLISIKAKLNCCIRDLLKPDRKIERENLSHEESNLSALSNSATPVVISENKIRIKLPKINIEKFDGNFENWQEFWCQFKSAIHVNESLNKVDKFTYLKSFLKDSAQIAIQGLSISEDNYDTAVKILEDRFGRKELLIRAHINKLLNLSPVRNSSNLKDLRQLYDTCEIQIRSLKSLGIELNTYGNLLFPILTKLIPDHIMLNYNRDYKDETESWDVGKLLEYLKTEVVTRERTLSFRRKESEESIGYSSKAFVKGKEQDDRDNSFKRGFKEKYKVPTAALLNASIDSQNYCVFCKGNHEIEKCPKPVNERKDILKKEGRCWNCLKFHLVRECKFKGRCKLCTRKHNTAICETSEKKEHNSNSETVVSSIQNKNEGREIYLQTATALALGKGNRLRIRVLFDLGSQRSFILGSIAEKLKLESVGEENITIHSFGSTEAVSEKRKRYNVVLRNLLISSQSTSIEVLETPKISEALIGVPALEIRRYFDENKLQLADRTYGNDPYYYQLSLLIGSDFYWKMVSGKICRVSNSLVASETMLGWTVNGTSVSTDVTVQLNSINVMKAAVGQNLSEADQELKDLLKNFWELDSLGIKQEKEQSDVESEVFEDFKNSVKFYDSRYEIRLPWNNKFNDLKDNYEVAMLRLKGLARKFDRSPELYEKYKAVIEDYLDKGIAEAVNDEPTSISYYMPHQAVIREDKTTTKLRVVFDASSHSNRSLSLNDCLHQGPHLNPDLLSILLNFRLHKIAFVADIESAFLQIGIAPSDRDAVRFLWIDDSHESDKLNPRVLRMKRVLFGAKPSPFLLSATIKYHINKYKEKYPEVFEILNNCLYVDDLISGADKVEQGLEIYKGVKHVLKEASFNMRKWKSNSRALQEHFDDEENSEDLSTENCKVLGYKWNVQEDTISIEMKELLKQIEPKKYSVTKREALQIIGRFFDPIGFLNPFTINARIIMQEMWKSGLGWDDKLPEELRIRWENWCSQLEKIQDLKIPRHYFGKNSEDEMNDVQFHCFVDASGNSFGAVIYARYQTQKQEILTRFVIAKIRVAPLKKLSLPRLELMGAIVGARLAVYLSKHLTKYKTSTFYFWTDSKVVLHWIHGNANDWKPFVQNRVLEIQKNSDKTLWSYCPGHENPADCQTRDRKPKSVLNDKWFQGPKWLKMESSFWPKIDSSNWSEEAESEKRKSKKINILQINCMTDTKTNLIDLKRFSRLSSLLRTTAWIFRFINNAKKNSNKQNDALSADEITMAEIYWIKQVQGEAFPEELQALSQKKPIPRNSRIANFNPFLDKDKIIRIGGRLQNANLTFAEIHPIILPDLNHFSDLQIKHAHEHIGHAGIAETLTQNRERMWILRGRQRVKRILRNCFICQRLRVKPYSQKISPLPPDRVREALPFEVCGVDFLGPLYTRDERKVYVALFTCAVVRAVHLELVNDLSAAEFLLAFRRFISRRGICKVVYSDNARTFKRTDKDIQKMFHLIKNQEVQHFFSENRIQWKYIVERAAWWGGFWERLVQSTKTCLKRILWRACLRYQELETTLTEVEAIINSRPLTFVYNETDEPSPLCPGHFLIGKRITALPPEKIFDVSSTKSDLEKRYRYRSTLLDKFWQKWRLQYVMDLRSAHRCPRNNSSSQITKDTFVMIYDYKKPRMMWECGLVVETHAGRDGNIRACTVRLSTGTLLKRAVQHLYPLELNSEVERQSCLSGPEDVE